MLNAVRDIFRVNLGVKKSERALVFCDRPAKGETVSAEDVGRREKLRDVAMLAAEVGRCFAKEIIFYEYPATGGHGIEPPLQLWELAFGKKTVDALKKAKVMNPILRKKAGPEKLAEAEEIIKRRNKSAVSAVIALSNFSTTHTTFRDFLTRLCLCRYASMPLFDVSMLEGPMNIDYKALAVRTKAVANLVNKNVSVDIKTPNGTDISFSIKGRRAKADTGIITRPGSTSNLPAGEAYLAPLEGTSNGRLVLEWAPTRKLDSPITLAVKDGLVTDISGDEEYVSYLRSKLDERKENRNIAELGIGTNEMAKRPDNILESEKILGTIHIALGDNSTFGGNVKTPFHQDFIFFRPTVTLINKDGKKTVLMKNGKLNI